MSGDVYWDVDLAWDVSDTLSVTFGGNYVFDAAPDPPPEFLSCCGAPTYPSSVMDCRVRITTFAVFSGGTDEIGDNFRWQSFLEAIYLPPFVAGLLRASVQHRYTQYCNVVRERLLIDQ